MSRVVILQGGLRVPSSTRMLAEELGRAITSEGPQIDVSIVDLRDHAHAIVDAMLSGFARPELQAVLDDVSAADGLALVSPTFQGSYAGLVKSFFDLIEPGSLPGTPMALAATGGTERHSLMLEFAMRPLAVYLGANPLRTAVFAATGDFGDSQLGARVQRVAKDLVAAMGSSSAVGLGSAAKVEAPNRELDDAGHDDIVDFESLMAQYGVGR